MITLGATFAGAGLALRGGKKEPKQPGPVINAQSKEEEEFIQYACALNRDFWSFSLDVNILTGVASREFIRNANAEEQKSKH